MAMRRNDLSTAGSPQKTVDADARAPAQEVKITSHRQYIMLRFEKTFGIDDPHHQKVPALRRLWKTLENGGLEQKSEEEKGRQAKLITVYQNHFSDQVLAFLNSADGQVFTTAECKIIGVIGTLYVAAYMLDMLGKFENLANRADKAHKEANVDHQLALQYVKNATEQFAEVQTAVAGFVAATTQAAAGIAIFPSDTKEEKNPRHSLKHALDQPKLKLEQLETDYQKLVDDLNQAQAIDDLNNRKDRLLNRFRRLKHEFEQVEFPELSAAEAYLKQTKTAAGFETQEEQAQTEIKKCESIFEKVRTSYRALVHESPQALGYNSEDMAILRELLGGAQTAAGFNILQINLRLQVFEITEIVRARITTWSKIVSFVQETRDVWDAMAVHIQVQLYDELFKKLVSGVFKTGITDKDQEITLNFTQAFTLHEQAQQGISDFCQTLRAVLPRDNKQDEKTVVQSPAQTGFNLRLFSSAKSALPAAEQKDAPNLAQHDAAHLQRMDVQLNVLKTALAQADMAYRKRVKEAETAALVDFEKQMAEQEKQRQANLDIVQERIQDLEKLTNQRILQIVACNYQREQEGRDIRDQVERANAEREEKERVRRRASNAAFVQSLEPRMPSSAPMMECKRQDPANQPAEYAPINSYKLPSSTRSKVACVLSAIGGVGALVAAIVIIATNPVGWVACLFLAAIGLATAAVELSRTARECDRKNKLVAKHQNKDYVNSHHECMPAQQALLEQDKKLLKKGFSEPTRNFMLNRGVIVKNTPNEDDKLGDVYTPCTAIDDQHLPIYINRKSGTFFLRYRVPDSKHERLEMVNDRNYDQEVEKCNRLRMVLSKA